ncbi:MAG: sulfotransferase [Chloroflexaceae bacterium]|nr:sulfotransferase [Chloroflexaceae bacterium]
MAMFQRQNLGQLLGGTGSLLKQLPWYFPATLSEQPHIFVVGAPRSGTTLVKLILNVHPNLSGPGYETGFFMFKHLSNLLLGKNDPSRQKLQTNTPDIVQAFDRFSQQRLKETGGQRFIEKTPPHVLRLPFLLKHFPKAQFINVFRDGRDCYCSARHHAYVTQGQSIETYARYWRRCLRSRFRQGEHPRILDVKYEDLVTNAESAVRGIMAFLAEEFEERQLDPRCYSQNTITRSKRQEFSKLSQPISPSSMNRWQKEMTAAEIERFEKIAGQELRRLGYRS